MCATHKKKTRKYSFVAQKTPCLILRKFDMINNLCYFAFKFNLGQTGAQK